jgi:hypothetical protein
MKLVEYVIVGVAAAVAGCASTNAGVASRVSGGKPEIMTLPLIASEQSAGEIGHAVLVARAEKTAVTVEVSGVPDYVIRPVHLYTYIHEGLCGKTNHKPAYSLTERVLASDVSSAIASPTIQTKGPFKVTNTAPIALDALRARPHAIEVRTSPADGNRVLFCGNIA